MSDESPEKTPKIVVVADLAGAPVALGDGVIYVADTGDPELNAHLALQALYIGVYNSLA